VIRARIVPGSDVERLSVDEGGPPLDDGFMHLGRLSAISPTVAGVLAAALLAAAASCPAALAKPGKLVGKGSDSGFPIAYARAFVKHPKALKVRVKASTTQPIELLWQVTCRRGGKKAKVPSGEFTVTPTSTRNLKKGTKRPDDCTVDVQAAYVTADVLGSIKIELFARKARKRR